MLTTRELTVFQDVLYSGTRKAYRLANLAPSDPDWLARYQPLHGDIARLFLDAAHELIARLDGAAAAKAA